MLQIMAISPNGEFRIWYRFESFVAGSSQGWRRYMYVIETLARGQCFVIVPGMIMMRKIYIILDIENCIDFGTELENIKQVRIIWLDALFSDLWRSTVLQGGGERQWLEAVYGYGVQESQSFEFHCYYICHFFVHLDFVIFLVD